jgi:hypothetical protein
MGGVMRKVMIGLGGMVVVLFVAAVLFPVFAQHKNGKGRCVSNLGRLAQACLIYSQDHDDRFPLANAWMDSIAKTVGNERAFHCDRLLVQGGYGYAMNAFLAGAEVKKLVEPGQMPLIHESSNMAKNVSEYMPAFPIPGRHNGLNYVVFADGRGRAIAAGK